MKLVFRKEVVKIKIWSDPSYFTIAFIVSVHGVCCWMYWVMHLKCRTCPLALGVSYGLQLKISHKQLRVLFPNAP